MGLSPLIISPAAITLIISRLSFSRRFHAFDVIIRFDAAIDTVIDAAADDTTLITFRCVISSSR